MECAGLVIYLEGKDRTMSQRELIDRLQQACQRGESLRKMAGAERLTADTVRQITSLPRFQMDLTMHLVNSSISQLNPSPRMDRRIGRALTKLLRLINSGALVPLSMQDLARLRTFSQQQRALAMSQQ